MSQDRATFQRLAEQRLAEAKLLFVNGHASGAYYLAGYAIECALKARIASAFQAGTIPSLSLVRDVYTHDLSRLLSLAELKDELEAAMKIDPHLKQCWTTVENWSEQARYELWPNEDARRMLEAVGTDDEGLLPWLKKHW